LTFGRVFWPTIPGIIAAKITEATALPAPTDGQSGWASTRTAALP
jgi:hypothetical protein